MEEKTNNLTTVAYSKNRAKELTSICKKLSISKAQFIDATIHQYYRTGEDPREPIKDSLPKKLTAIENKIISFIKVQDKKYLEEIVNALSEMDKVTKSTHIKVGSHLTERLLNIQKKVIGADEETSLTVLEKRLSSQMNSNHTEVVKNENFLYNEVLKIQKAVELTDDRKKKALAQVKALKGTLGVISQTDVISIIANM